MNRFGASRILLSYYLLQKNFLSKTGWTKSVFTGAPVDKKNEPIPWFTYSFLNFLTDRIRPEMKIFEFGSGNSTIWFSSKGCQLFSIEHNPAWYDRMRNMLRDRKNVSLKLASKEDNSYSSAILEFEGFFDIIIIDGRDRVNCARNSLGALKPGGVIIWDNSDRPDYYEGYEYLLEHGFKRLDFHGFGPINSRSWCTSLFYRKTNCLGV